MLSAEIESMVVKIPDFCVLKNNRDGKRGYLKNNINCSLVPFSFKNDHHLEIVGVLHRPPTLNLHQRVEHLDDIPATLITVYSNIRQC